MKGTKFEKRIMEVHFPNLRKTFDQMRIDLGKNSVPMFAAKIEASVIFGTINQLDFPAKSIHDGILVPESRAEEVKALMLINARAAIGFTPHVRIK